MSGARRIALGICLIVSALWAGMAPAQQASEEKKKEEKNWSNKTELGLTSTSGNSEVTNFSLSDEYKRHWKKAELTFDLSAINNRSVSTTYTLDTNNQPVLVDQTDTTAETYTMGLAYRRDISGRLFWYVNGRWARNEPAGLLDRYRGGAGIGYAFLTTKRHTLKGEVGATYTDETKSVDVPPTFEASSTYTSGTVLVDYKFKVSENAELTSVANSFMDVDQTDNWQANWVTALTANLTTKLALSVSYTVVYDNNPADILIAPGVGTPAGSAPLPFPAEKTDRFLTASVVLKF